LSETPQVNHEWTQIKHEIEWAAGMHGLRGMTPIPSVKIREIRVFSIRVHSWFLTQVEPG